jgi:sirohydrochlorin ferrochelatase
MAAFIWVLPIALSTLLGISLVSYLTVHPLQMGFYVFIATVAMSALVWVLASLFQGRNLLLAVGLSLLFFSAGYGLRTRQVLSQEDSRSVPKLTRLKGDPGDGHTAVVYITHGEPETFNPIGWLNQFREFDQQGIPFVPWMVRPIFIFQLRRAYLQVGQSHHRQMHIQMLKQLEGAFRAEGDTSTKFYLSFLDDEPRPDAALIQALNDGASRIVVAEVFVSISNHTAEGEKLIKEVHAEELGVPVVFTSPLWDSVPLQQSFVVKLDAAMDGTDKAKVGVILVGHGQPDEWDQEFPTETEHELSFREQILKKLEADGYRMENMGLAWMEFKEPRPAEKVEALIMNGVEKIFYFPAAISADSIHSQYDIPELIGEAKVPAGFPLVNLGAWNDHPLVIQAIKEKIQSAQKMSSQ